MHLGVAIGHLSFPLLFFPDQVTHPGRIRPRLCTLHSFLTSFLFSMPGGSWTVSSLACKCICASSVQWSMSIWMFSLPSFAFLSVPCIVWSMPSLLTLWGHCWMELKLPDSFFLNWGKRVESALFFPFLFFPSIPPPSLLFELPFSSNLTLPSGGNSWQSDNQLWVIWVQRSIAIINYRILELTKASTPPSGNSSF